MKMGSALANRRGVSLVETMIAVVLIASVGVIIVELLHKNTIALAWNRQTRKAAALADMVLEKYDYLASVQFSGLELVNQTNASPSTFFATGTDNQGYNGMTITTVADPAGADGTRRLTVTIGWGANAANQTFTITKYLTPGTGVTGGAPVHVYVLDNTGAGVQGFEVRAAHHFNPAYLNAIGTNEVIAFTDANGYAVLNNVSIDPANQPMPVYAKKPGSDVHIQRSDPAYVLGYYVSPDPHQEFNTKTITVTQTSANNVTFDMRNNDFFPLATVSGHISNLSGGPNDNMAIDFVGNGASSAYNNIQLGSSWTVYSSGSGDYEFNNVAPGAYSMHLHGNIGSDPTVAPGNPGYQVGYVGWGGNGSQAWHYDYTMPDPALNMPVNMQMKALGSLAITVTSIATGSLLPGATVSFTWPDIGLRNSTPWTGTTDTNGQINLYNMIIQDATIPFSASLAGTSCSSPGAYLHNYGVAVTAGISNPVALSLNPAGTISGTLTSAGGAPIPNMQVAVTGASGQAVQTVTSNVAGTVGTFQLCGVSPDISGWPTIPFTYTDLSGNRVSATFSGNAVDKNYPTQTIPNLTVVPAVGLLTVATIHNTACATDPNPAGTTNDVITTSNLGAYGPICEYQPFQATQNQTVSGSAPNYTIGTVVVSTLTMTSGLKATGGFYSGSSTRTVIANGGLYTLNLPATLQGQTVSGVLTAASNGQSLGNMTFDACGGCPSPLTSCSVTTDSGGNFGPVTVCVLSRTNSNPGKVTIAVPSGLLASNGKVYSGATQSATIPTPATPGTALTVNFSLNRQGGGI